MKWILALLAATAAFGQTTAPAFEVASVKLEELPPGTFRFGDSKAAPLVRINGNRVTVNSNLAGLAAAAYEVKSFQITGAPQWTDSRGREEFYRIEAKTESEATPRMGQVRQCLQTLLAGRFQLKVHRDTVTLPVYNLVVGKNGLKLKESNGDGEPRVSNSPSGPSSLRFSNYSIGDLINILSVNVDRPVLDKTGLTGRYDYTLEFTRGNPEVAGDSADDRPIFSAIQRQLGLQLVRSNEPCAIVVIDHAEKPAAN